MVDKVSIMNRDTEMAVSLSSSESLQVSRTLILSLKRSREVNV